MPHKVLCFHVLSWYMLLTYFHSLHLVSLYYYLLTLWNNICCLFNLFLFYLTICLVKYELIKAITSTTIMHVRGFHGHVNFTTKRSLENWNKEFFLAELCFVRHHNIYTCIVSLEGKERIGQFYQSLC